MTQRSLAQDKRRTKDLLLLAYHFPPHTTPHALRWYHLSRELAQLGYAIDVVTTRMPRRFHDEFFPLHPKVSVHRTFPGPFFESTFRLSREQISTDLDAPAEAVQAHWKRLQKLHGEALRLLNALLFPDAYGEWLPFAAGRALELTRRHRYRFVVSTSEPRVGHLAGWLVQRLAAVPWIADYGDPWVYPITHGCEPEWKKRLLQQIESRILRRAQALTVTAQAMIPLYRQRYPFLKKRPLRVVAQGYDAQLLASIVPRQCTGFQLVYCGSLYANLRDPRPVFRAIRSLGENDLQLLIAGRINEFSETVQSSSLRRWVCHRGFVHHRAALALEKGATVLLHIANATDAQVPGKIYEYLGAARPILVVTNHRQDPAGRLVLQMNRGLVVKNHPDPIQQALRQLLAWWRRGDLDRHFDLASTPNGSWQDRAKQFHCLLQEVAPT